MPFCGRTMTNPRGWGKQINLKLSFLSTRNLHSSWSPYTWRINFKNKYLISLFINKWTVFHSIVSGWTVVAIVFVVSPRRRNSSLRLLLISPSPDMIYSIMKCDVERLSTANVHDNVSVLLGVFAQVHVESTSKMGKRVAAKKIPIHSVDGVSVFIEAATKTKRIYLGRIAFELNKFQYWIHFISHINGIFHPFIISLSLFPSLSHIQDELTPHRWMCFGEKERQREGRRERETEMKKEKRPNFSRSRIEVRDLWNIILSSNLNMR